MLLFITSLVGILYAEIVGYIVHRVIHSERFPILSKNHMIHHLEHYGPNMPMRSSGYKASTEGRPSIAGIGFEWLGPIALMMAPIVGISLLFNILPLYQFVFYSFSIIWGLVGFSYMHDSMHIADFWMLKVPMLNVWFKRARRLHDIHHISINDDGRMNDNFGIVFFFLDKLVGSYVTKISGLNREGFEKAKKTYSYIYKQ